MKQLTREERMRKWCHAHRTFDNAEDYRRVVTRLVNAAVKWERKELIENCIEICSRHWNKYATEKEFAAPMQFAASEVQDSIQTLGLSIRARGKKGGGA